MLTREELRSLIRAFGEVCRFISDIKARCPVASHVQYPKIPPILSESLALHAIREGHLLASFGPFTSVILGGHKADVVATLADGRDLLIETKASGEGNFATFGKKDYAADFLIWLRFESLLRESKLGRIEVLICPHPSEHLPWNRDRVTVAQLCAAWNGEIGREFIDLQLLLGPVPNKLLQ